MPLPERVGVDEDFLYQLLYKYTKDQVRLAYVNALISFKKHVPQIPEATMRLADRVKDHDAMVLHLLLILISDDKNDFTRYVYLNVNPRFRLEYFIIWFKDFSKHFMGAMANDPHVPDPRVVVATVRGEYIRRRDNGNRFRKHLGEYVPPGSRRCSGT